MAKAKYKRTITTTDKVNIEGFFNIDDMTFDVDGEIIDLKDKLSDLHGKYLSVIIALKTEEEIE